jgi:hypothetical protein
MTARLSRCRKELVTLEARVTVYEVDRFTEQLNDNTISVDRCGYFAESIRSRLQDEMNLIKLLVLDSESQNYYAPKSPLFDDLFADKFKRDGAFELDEAAKCIALARPTGAVFHLMRLMEVGVRALARCLDIPDPLKPAERNWGHILTEIKKGIDLRWPTAATRANGDGALFERLHASLDAVKNPWRNATMHVENKYTDDEAKHIFAAVKGFMGTLAGRCDENGDPMA